MRRQDERSDLEEGEGKKKKKQQDNETIPRPSYITRTFFRLSFGSSKSGPCLGTRLGTVGAESNLTLQGAHTAHVRHWTNTHRTRLPPGSISILNFKVGTPSMYRGQTLARQSTITFKLLVWCFGLKLSSGRKSKGPDTGQGGEETRPSIAQPISRATNGTAPLAPPSPPNCARAKRPRLHGTLCGEALFNQLNGPLLKPIELLTSFLESFLSFAPLHLQILGRGNVSTWSLTAAGQTRADILCERSKAGNLSLFPLPIQLPSRG